MYQRAGEYPGELWAESADEEGIDGFVFHVRSVVSGPEVALEAFEYLSADWRRYQ